MFRGAWVSVALHQNRGTGVVRLATGWLMHGARVKVLFPPHSEWMASNVYRQYYALANSLQNTDPSMLLARIIVVRSVGFENRYQFCLPIVWYDLGHHIYFLSHKMSVAQHNDKRLWQGEWQDEKQLSEYSTYRLCLQHHGRHNKSQKF
jgi:hypothetical protein